MKQLFQELNALRVLAFFFRNPFTETHLREIARQVKMSPATVLRCVKLLEKEGLVSRRTEKNATFFKPTMSAEFKALKTAFTIANMEKAKVVEFISEKSRGLSSVLLYGSAAKGEDDSKSDYDFLVVAAECGATPLELSERLGRETSLQKHSISEWKAISRKNRAFYLEVISNSVVLKGEKPVID